MNDQSPPKRVTRARAKAADAGLTVTKIATAASKARTTRTNSTTKRKTRTDDNNENENLDDAMNEMAQSNPPIVVRGRPRKVQPQPEVEEEIPIPTKAARGRPKKVVTEDSTATHEPTRATRGRPKKVDVTECDSIVVEEPLSTQNSRARAVTATKATALKKTVKFEEPDKENIVPVNNSGKTKVTEATTGLRAKPVRKPATTTTRTTRGRAKTLTDDITEKPAPLSPKKATQVATAKDLGSDDEISTSDKTPMLPLMKSPVKPHGSIFGTAKKIEASSSIAVYNVGASLSQDPRSSIMASPARRPPQSSSKESLNASPQRVGMGDSLLRSPFKMSIPAPTSFASKSPLKASLLQSPARRPQSPTKVTNNGSPSRSANVNPVFSAIPMVNKLKMSRLATPRTAATSAERQGLMLPPSSSMKVLNGNTEVSKVNDHFNAPPVTGLTFSGRLSAIIPREADSANSPPPPMIEETKDQFLNPSGQEPMILDTAEDIPLLDTKSTTPPCSPPRYSTGAFGLRQADENPMEDSDSEDELAFSPTKYSRAPLGGFQIRSPDFTSSPATPTPFFAINKSPRTAMINRSSARDRSIPRAQIGFTPLARQLNDWMTASPIKAEVGPSDTDEIQVAAEVSSPVITPGMGESVQASVKHSFFDDEMSVRDDMTTSADENDQNIIEEPNFSPVEIDEEDLELAQEADEMSLLEPDTSSEDVNGHSDIPNYVEAAPSEASQEYGDENEVPIDPELLSAPSLEATARPAFATPKRVLSERVFHTVSKIPLKPAAEESPLISVKRSASISRLPVQRPSGNLTRSNTVISYSPTKSVSRLHRPPETPEDVHENNMETPSREDIAMWSTIGSPVRTPRRDLNTGLLKGAIVFVDVHTSEGADASAVFTELLSQMGARCVRSWTWNAKAEEGSKIGITHVIFKDGGKRTLEKVRETGGVVSCVGVGWVLDCERENKWLDESPYAVDTGLVPRGGHRRRKSMEPRALANLNGTLISSSSTTPSRTSNTQMSPTKEFLHLQATPLTCKAKRRDSVQWVRSPAAPNQNDNHETFGDEAMALLSPVPATPAPETISAYGEEYLNTLNGSLNGEETPSAHTPYFLQTAQLVQQTAPVTRKYDCLGGESGNVGIGFLSEKKDESVMMRLMAARRKSLQWAPKVGSPLARGGEWGL